MTRCLCTGTAMCQWRILIQWSGIAEGYKMRYFTLQLDPTSGSRLATDRGNDVFTMSLPSLQLQQSLRHDMANTGFYTMALHVLYVRMTLEQNRHQQTHTTNSNDLPTVRCTFATYKLTVFPNVLAAKGFKNGTLARDCNGVKRTVFRIHNTRYLACMYFCVWPLPTVVMAIVRWRCEIADHLNRAQADVSVAFNDAAIPPSVIATVRIQVCKFDTQTATKSGAIKPLLHCFFLQVQLTSQKASINKRTIGWDDRKKNWGLRLAKQIATQHL
jgi:hypothetical protein